MSRRYVKLLVGSRARSAEKGREVVKDAKVQQTDLFLLIAHLKTKRRSRHGHVPPLPRAVVVPLKSSDLK